MAESNDPKAAGEKREISRSARELYEKLYPRLRRVAKSLMRGQRPGHTLPPTALANEAFAKLDEGREFDNTDDFFRLARKIMQDVLVDYARGRNRQKRGGGEKPVPLNEEEVPMPVGAVESVEMKVLRGELSHALDTMRDMGRKDAQIGTMHRVVTLYLQEQSTQEIATAVNLPEFKVRSVYRSAKLWLLGQLDPPR